MTRPLALWTTRGFGLIETLLWERHYHRLEPHLQRLARSAATFGLQFDPAAARSLLAERARDLAPGARYKVRLVLHAGRGLTWEAAPLGPPPTEPAVLLLSAEPTRSSDPLLRHKTTRRALYASAERAATRAGVTDLLFLNERGEITEGARHNLFVERGGRLLTPPVTSGALPGVYRAQVLATNPNAGEATLRPADLLAADAVYICNSVRGWRRAVLRDPEFRVPLRQDD